MYTYLSTQSPAARSSPKMRLSGILNRGNISRILCFLQPVRHYIDGTSQPSAINITSSAPTPRLKFRIMSHSSYAERLTQHSRRQPPLTSPPPPHPSRQRPKYRLLQAWSGVGLVTLLSGRDWRARATGCRLSPAGGAAWADVCDPK